MLLRGIFLADAPRDAYELHRRLPDSVMHFVCAGHSASEPKIREKLIEELGRLSA